MAKIDDLEAAVKRETDAEESVITLLQGISQQLKDAQASGDPARVDAVIASIDANTNRLSAAVTANTPSSQLNHREPSVPFQMNINPWISLIVLIVSLLIISICDYASSG